MAGKVQARREKLRADLIDIAERIIAAEGPSEIKARRLATEAGCATGAIYNVFEDLDQVIMEVNGRTFKGLGESVAASLVGNEGKTPTERLILMSYAYLDFAAEHPLAWRALFDVRLSTDMDIPTWYLSELERLFSYIARPVQEIFKDLGPKETHLMVRALFSSVHGIVLLGLENRISGVPRAELEKMIALLLRQLTVSEKI